MWRKLREDKSQGLSAPGLIIGSDTVVVMEDVILEKPKVSYVYIMAIIPSPPLPHPPLYLV